MKLKFVYGIFPCLLTITDEMAENRGGYTKWPFVFIRPKYEKDEGLLQHELTHIKQAYRRLIIFHSLLYQMSDWYKLRCEVEAYKVQLKYVPYSTCFEPYVFEEWVKLFAGFISTIYKLNISQEKAERLLRQ